MTRACWHFNEMRPCDKARDPIQGEFFAADAISNLSEALIREGIQNSLDAAPGGRKVEVRIRISGTDGAVPRSKIAHFFDGLDEHLKSIGNGLRDIPHPDEDCPFLIFEDFGTTGLLGDSAEWKPAVGARNNFYHFFRAEGRSDKRDNQIGRWGAGKQVFPRASRINSIFGLTVREDDGRKMLMGMAVMKSHDVNGTRYGPDGWFGCPSGAGDGSLILPIEDTVSIDSFSKIFNSTRANRSGLTIVVPWYDLDLTDESLIRAVLRGYFWPILRNRLRVLIETENIKTSLDSSTLEREVKRFGGDLEKETLPLVELARWSGHLKEADFVTLEASHVWQWSQSLFPSNVLESIRERHERGQRIALRVPVAIQKKGIKPRASHFDVFFVRDGADRTGVPVYIREGIIIPDVRRYGTGVLRGVRSLVVAEDGPIAGFLGDSENPAHTQWQKNGTNFKGKYEDGAKILDFVIHSVIEIVRIVSQQDSKEDRTLLSDLFSIPAPPAEPETDTRRKKQRKPEGPPTPPGPHPRPFIIDKTKGGFVVRNGDPNGSPPPKAILVRMAYQIRRGNPFKKYHPADFSLSRDLTLQFQGATPLKKAGNMLQAKIDGSDFRIEVTGFDQNRDVRIEVRRQEDDNADSDA